MPGPNHHGSDVWIDVGVRQLQMPRSYSPSECLALARATWMERTIWSLDKMSELRIDAHWTRNLWLAMLDIDRQWWRQALSALATEHAKDLLLGAVRGA